jgi:hypothetical protein
MVMNRIVLEGGSIVITQMEPQRWEISTVSLQFLDWMRESFGDWEDEEWSLVYYSGSVSLIVVHDERIITMALLRWL